MKKRLGKIDPIEFDRGRTKISIKALTEMFSFHQK